MAQETDTITLQFLEKGSAELEAKLISLERRSLKFMKAINTAMKNNNLSTAKANRTKLKNNELAIKSDRIEKKEIDAKIKSIKNAESATMLMSRKFLQAGLSVMFFGMMMQKAFQDLATKSLTTFNKLNSDTEVANNATNRLSAGMEGLSYVIGDSINTVLEGMEGFLSNIISYVMDFIDKNQSWIGFAVIVGLIIGTIMTLIGQFGLLFLGLGALKGTAGFAGFGAAAKTATAAGSKGILGMIGPVLSLAAVWGLLIGLFTSAEWPRKLLTNFVKLVGNIVISIIWLALKIIKFLGGAFGFVAELIGNAFTWAFKGVINIVIRAINSILSLVEQMINKIAKSDVGKLLGLKTISIGKLQEIENKGFKTRLAEMSDKFVAFMQEDDFNLKGATDALSRGVDETLGVGLERMFAKNEENTEKQTVAADTNLAAAQMNYEASKLQWESIMGGTPSSGGVTSGYNNGTVSWSSVIGGATT